MESESTTNAQVRSVRRPVGKPLVLITVLTLGLLVIYATPLRGYLRHVSEIRATVQNAGTVRPIEEEHGEAQLKVAGIVR